MHFNSLQMDAAKKTKPTTWQVLIWHCLNFDQNQYFHNLDVDLLFQFESTNVRKYDLINSEILTGIWPIVLMKIDEEIMRIPNNTNRYKIGVFLELWLRCFFCTSVPKLASECKQLHSKYIRIFWLFLQYMKLLTDVAS